VSISKLTMARRIAAYPVLVMGLALGACGVSPQRLVDTKAAASRIAARLAATTGLAAQVHCPDKVADHIGATFDCLAQLDGQKVEIAARVKDAQGDISLVPTEAIISVPAAEASLSTELSKAAGATPKVDCGPSKVIIKPPGSTFVCQATFAGQAPRSLRVTVINVAGGLRVALSPSASSQQ